MTNFLPTHKRRKSGRGGKNLVCLIRNKTVISTPEEHVRQRVLHWLLEEKGWSKEFIRLEYSYPIVRKKGKYFVRPDIELLDEFQRVKIVIECKNEEETLDQRVMNQAKEYASKSGAHWIWMTNGENHIFLERQHFAEGHKRKAHWGRVSQIPILGVTFKPPKLEFNIPDDSNDKRELSKYIKNFPRDQHGGTSGLEIATDYLRRFIVDFHKLIFDQSQNDARLPYSFDGVHILEHRGRNFRFFSNASGGLWCGLYSDYLVATEGRVDTLSASILGWGGKASNELRLCVGVYETGKNPSRTANERGKEHQLGRKRWLLECMERRQNEPGQKLNCHGGHQGRRSGALSRRMSE